MAPKSKPTKKLVTVGTFVPESTKITLHTIAEAQNKSLYQYLQDLLEKEASEFISSIEALKKGESPPETLEDTANDDGEDLLS